jgi:hypothetical protein
MQQLTGREEVKALPLQTIFEDATHGEDTVFGHSDADTFEFAKRHARTATQRLVDSAGQRFSGRVRVLTDPSSLTITYCRAGTDHVAAPAARRRVERMAAKSSGRMVETRELEPRGSKNVPGGAKFDDPTLAEGDMLYWCHCSFYTVGPAYKMGDDIRCAHCQATRLASMAEDAATDDGEESKPTIYPTHVIEGGIAVVLSRAAAGRPARRRRRKDVRDGDLGEAITEAAEKVRKTRAKRGRESLARRRGRV